MNTFHPSQHMSPVFEYSDAKLRQLAQGDVARSLQEDVGNGDLTGRLALTSADLLNLSAYINSAK